MNIALFGATGRLGRSIAALAQKESKMSVVEAIAHSHSSSLGEEILPNLFVTDTFQHKASIAIDVSLPQESILSLQANLPLVIGTTALSPHAMDEIKRASKRLPIFYTPNFSIGMALFKQFCKDVATKLPNCTLNLSETHHEMKKDAPSGSALFVARELEKEGKEVRIHSKRIGQVIGEHTFIASAPEETLEITHSALSREVFARGALEAARFLEFQKPGLYGMDDLLLYLKQ